MCSSSPKMNKLSDQSWSRKVFQYTSLSLGILSKLRAMATRNACLHLQQLELCCTSHRFREIAASIKQIPPSGPQELQNQFLIIKPSALYHPAVPSNCKPYSQSPFPLKHRCICILM